MIGFRLRLRGRAAVFVDWANVYGWKKSLKEEVDSRKLYKYLKSYKEIKDINLYHGTDQNEHSRKFLRIARSIGREIWEIKKGLFKVSIENMGL